MESGIFRVWLSPVETCLGMYDCVSLISGYWAICWRRWTECVRTVSPSRLTSVPAIVFCLVVGVVFVGCCCFLVLVLFVLLCLFSRLAPYTPSYISYDDSSHSEWALDFLLGRSTTGVAFLIPS